MSKKSINRLKVVLVEHERTNKWLAQKLNRSSTTVSRWCTNDMQPSLVTLVKISKILDVNIHDLITPTK